MNPEQTHKYGEGMPPVAVIILNWNGSALLREFLPQVIATTNAATARIIVADNGSDDDSLQVLESEFAGVNPLNTVADLTRLRLRPRFAPFSWRRIRKNRNSSSSKDSIRYTERLRRCTTRSWSGC